MGEVIDPRLNKIIDCLYRVASKAVVVHDGKLLLVREEQGWYGVPGGGIDHGQGPRESLVRELLEELGTEIAIEQIPEQPSFVGVGGAFNGIPRVTIYYRVEIDETEFENASELNHRWVTADELKEIELGPNIAVSRDELFKILAA